MSILQMIQDRILNLFLPMQIFAYDQLKGFDAQYKNAGKGSGNVLVGQEAVDAGLINEVGGIREALKKLYEMIDESCAKNKGF